MPLPYERWINKDRDPMKKANQITGVILLIFSGYVIMESLRMPLLEITGRTTFAPPTGFLPKWLGVLMAILSLLLIIHSTLQQSDAPREAIFPRGRALAAVLLFMVGLTVYFTLLEVLGYLLATFLLISFLLRFVMQADWKMTLPVAAGGSVCLFVIFQVMLHVNLPKNMFGF